MQPQLKNDRHPSRKPNALETLWNRISEELVERLGQAEFDRWFSPVKLVRIDTDSLCFSVPNPIYSLWIEENYLTEFQDIVAKNLPTHPPIRFEVAITPEPIPVERGDHPNDSVETLKLSADIVQFPEPPLRSDLSDDADSSLSEPARMADSSHDSESVRKWKSAGKVAGLNPVYQFDNFVVGTANRLACAAAKAVAEKPGRTYHPLFIHSASGLGKTHLLHAIGWDALRRRPKSKVVYISAERFANEYIEAIQKHDLVAFRKRYRQADVLLIDDIQFLSGKEGMQEEFFHTFNSLTDRHKQIVLASDRPATEIREIEDRLVSRFQWGMTAEIVAPTMETRIAILRRKREERSAKVADWIIDYIANHVTSNVRAMEGALIRAATLTSINIDDPGQIDEPTLANLLSQFTDAETARQVSVHEIQELVAEYFELSVRDITGRRRTSRLVEARHVAMALTRERTDLSLTEIGKEFGGRDHGTIINACKRVNAKIESSAQMKRSVEYLRRTLLAGPSTRRSRSGYRSRDRED
ncbi:MAG: chromosomal replication initiator protein DnaA [Verrucomicrobiae bacterium]|nr:chromosomal replication initiator protein DnaA [Verrucomicrobiae bacterium]